MFLRNKAAGIFHLQALLLPPFLSNHMYYANWRQHNENKPTVLISGIILQHLYNIPQPQYCSL